APPPHPVAAAGGGGGGGGGGGPRRDPCDLDARPVLAYEPPLTNFVRKLCQRTACPAGPRGHRTGAWDRAPAAPAGKGSATRSIRNRTTFAAGVRTAWPITTKRAARSRAATGGAGQAGGAAVSIGTGCRARGREGRRRANGPAARGPAGESGGAHSSRSGVTTSHLRYAVPVRA